MVRDAGPGCNVLAGLFKRQFCGLIDGAFQQPHRYLRPAAEFIGEVADMISQFSPGHDLVDQPEFKCLIGTDNLFSNQKVDGPGDPHVLNQQELATFIGQQPESQGGAAQPCLAGGNLEVA